MLEQHTFTREGKTYTAHKGTAESGLEALYIKPEFPAPNGQPLHVGPQQIVINLNPMTGQPLSIYTNWQEIQLSNSGEPISVTDTGMYSNKKDLADFCKLYGKQILGFSLNGFVRAILGFNRQPVMGPAGFVDDSAYDTTLAPTNDYLTHNADGTSIPFEDDPTLIPQ